MKDKFKILGAEILYLLAVTVISGLATLIQTIARIYDGDYSSFIWSGSNYRYNVFFYILGVVIFVGSMIAGYTFFLKKRIRDLNQSDMILKILFPVMAAIFAVIMLAAIVCCLLIVVGISDNMRPELLFNLTTFGWPIFTLVYMTVVEIIAVKKWNG